MYINQVKDSPKSRTGIIIGIAAIINVAIVGVIAFLSSGQTTTSGVYPAPVSTDALSCTSTTYIYPFFTDVSDTHSLKINIALGQSTIDSISIISSISYPTDDEALNSRDVNHAALNSSFAESKISVDELEPVYSKKDNDFNFSLYATSKKLNSSTLKYFLLEDAKPTDYNLKSLSSILGKKGFNCVANNP